MRSKFEEKVAEKLGDLVEYEPIRLPFIQPEAKRNYIPDFRYKGTDNLYIECKGRFTSHDRKKMLLVKQQHPNITFRLLFMNASVRLTKSSKTTYGEWAEKNGFEWADFRKGIPKKWLKPTV